MMTEQFFQLEPPQIDNKSMMQTGRYLVKLHSKGEISSDLFTFLMRSLICLYAEQNINRSIEYLESRYMKKLYDFLNKLNGDE